VHLGGVTWPDGGPETSCGGADVLLPLLELQVSKQCCLWCCAVGQAELHAAAAAAALIMLHAAAVVLLAVPPPPGGHRLRFFWAAHGPLGSGQHPQQHPGHEPRAACKHPVQVSRVSLRPAAAAAAAVQ
jgi:hypothetical protein